MFAKNKISVTVVTGFLGAGKTTFINELLKTQTEKQFALVENEFGEVSIDSKLIKGIDVSQMFELRNGCICCTVTDEYELALKELAERFPEVEHLLVETSGIADPGPVIRPFFIDTDLKELYTFNGTVCLVDARYFHIYPTKKTAFRQLAVADVVVITKTEDFSISQKEEFMMELKMLNPLAVFHLADFGKVSGFDLEHIQHKIKFTPRYDEEHNKHEYLQVKTISFAQPVIKLKFTTWLSYNLDIYKDEIYRVKGILCFENEPFEYILQGVGGSFELTEGDLILNETVSEMVFIGMFKKVDFIFG
jgi:G3E family GTPase